MSQYPPPAGRTGFHPIDPAYPRPSDDHVVNIPLTPIESHRTITKDEGSTDYQGSSDKSRPEFNRGVTDPALDILNKRRGGKRQLLPKHPGSFSDGQDDTLTKMGRFYERVMNFSFITRWLIYIAPLALLLAIPIIVGATAAPHAELGGVRIVWIFAWTEVVWCSLWASKIVAKCLPYVFKALIGVVSSGTRKYYKVIQQLELPLSIVGWTFASWLSFLPMMTRNPDKRLEKDEGNEHAFDTQAWEHRLNQILAACLVASLIFFVKSLIVQLISVQYHQKQFSARIATNKESIAVLTGLLDVSRHMFPSYCPEFAEEDYILHFGLVSAMGTPGHSKSGSATPMRLFHQIGRVGDNITSAVGGIAKEITGKNVLNPNSSRSIVVDALARKPTMEALARRIWMSFAEEGNESLTQNDLIDVLGSDRREDAAKAFALLDKDTNNDITLDEMVAVVADVARERKILAKSMGDIDSAISALNSLLSAIIFVVVIFVFLAFLNQSFVTTLATAGTALLSLSFVFAGTAQEILGSCVFIFVKHPYDVGDRIDLDTKEYVVEHISLLYTVFRHVESNKFVQIPNNILNAKYIENVSRSGAMRETVVFNVNFETSMRDIMLLRSELLNFVNENNRDFRAENLNVEISGLKLDSLELRVEIKHKGNWADEPKRLERRNMFMAALVSALRKIPIYGPGAGDPGLGEAANAQYIVNLDYAEAQKRKAAAAKDKQDKRYKTPDEIADEQAAAEEEAAAGGSSSVQRPGLLSTIQSASSLAVEQQNAGASTADPRDETLLSDKASLMSHTQSIRRQDLDQVREIMRRQSTVGRRRRNNSAGSNQMTSPTGSGLYPLGLQQSLGQTSSSRSMQGSPLPPAQYASGYQPYQTQSFQQGPSFQLQSQQQGGNMPVPPPAPTQMPPQAPRGNQHGPY